MARRLSLPFLLVLCLALGSPLLGSPLSTGKVQLAPNRTQTAATGDLPGRFWQRLTALRAAAGCILDPDGARCIASTNGSSVVSPAVPAGCIIDPNGCR
jgi:hypothetical protein